MSKYAELLVQGWDSATVVRSVDPELEKARMAHEKETEKQKNELREKELNAERERNELERQKNELREKELAAQAEQRAADAEQRELRKAELIMQERLEREKWNSRNVWRVKN